MGRRRKIRVWTLLSDLLAILHGLKFGFGWDNHEWWLTCRRFPWDGAYLLCTFARGLDAKQRGHLTGPTDEKKFFWFIGSRAKKKKKKEERRRGGAELRALRVRVPFIGSKNS